MCSLLLLEKFAGLSLDFLLIILDPELVEVLARGVALWVDVLVVEDLPDRLSMGLVRGAEVLPCLVLVLNALPDVVSLEEAEEKDWNLSFLVTLTILTISTSSLSEESEEDPSSELDDSIVITSGTIRAEFWAKPEVNCQGLSCCTQSQL